MVWDGLGTAYFQAPNVLNFSEIMYNYFSANAKLRDMASFGQEKQVSSNYLDNREFVPSRYTYNMCLYVLE